jgi:hypothetical protein
MHYKHGAWNKEHLYLLSVMAYVGIKLAVAATLFQQILRKYFAGIKTMPVIFTSTRQVNLKYEKIHVTAGFAGNSFFSQCPASQTKNCC